jgi:thiol-disulfide isomerase/thioredoxin
MAGEVLAFLLLLESATAGIVSDVRAAIARDDFSLAEGRLNAYRAQHGVTSEMLEALSWLGRGALASKQLDKADAYAAETRRLALEQLRTRKLDADKHLPLALGASIEVQAAVLAERGQRAEAVSFLTREFKTYRATSIRARIQKNINLLSLEGKPAPPLEIREWLGSKPLPLAELKGRTVLLFFWAHWCPDCKAQAPVLAKLQGQYAGRGLVLMGPTQHYGYVQRGREAPPEQELRYIEEVRGRSYSDLAEMPVPVSEENFTVYGASTVPTLVLIDRQGMVRLYHPGAMSYEELAARVEVVIGR